MQSAFCPMGADQAIWSVAKWRPFVREFSTRDNLRLGTAKEKQSEE
jgi:hypothetical protein